ncbi:hypothetical protein JA1_001978 [Spathaspora sp. JA1]|nr:hypothetical protein JA1_001978 [Spathaspora sp. JA1]
MFDLPTHLPNEVPIEPTDQSTKISSEPAPEEISEEPQVKPNEIVYIPGTNISLQTEEDINKWIEERKRNWPSKKVVAQKQQQKQEQQSGKDKPDNKSKAPESTTPNKRSKTICKFYQQYKKCKFGNKCKNIHQDSNHELTHYTKNIKGTAVLIPKLYSNRVSANPRLFKNLILQSQIEENDQIIEFIKYLDKNGYIN